MKFIAAFFAVLLAASFNFGQGDQLRQNFRAFTRVNLNTANLNSLARSGDPIMITDGEKSFTFTVEPRDLRGGRGRGEEVTTFRGKVVGEPDSMVRLSIDRGRFEGYIFTQGTMWFIESQKRHVKKAKDEEYIIYRAADALEHVDLKDPLAVGTLTPPETDPFLQNVFAVDGFRVLDVATEADYQYTNAMGGAASANTAILSILNMVEGIYERQLGISINVTFQNAWSTPDPYTGTDGELLNSFLNRWNSVYPQASYPRNVAHLFTGKVSSAGIAYVGTVCRNPSYSYGYSGRTSTLSTASLIAAHEIGHNFSAEHVENSGTCASSIMNPSINQFVTEFCPTSVAQISGYVTTSGSCLRTVGPSPTPTPTPTPTPVPTPYPTPYPTPTPVPTPYPTPYPGPGRTTFDFDGDRRADVSVFRPADGTWYVLGSGVGSFGQRFGLSTDTPVAADYDGDSRTDIAVFRAGQWHILGSSQGYSVTSFGVAGDVPQPADYDGDGRAEIAVFRPSNGTWYTLNRATGQSNVVRFGLLGDKAYAADYDGDGRADFAVFRPSDRNWYILGSSSGFSAYGFGLSTDRAVASDYDGDGRTDIAVYRSGTWYIQRSSLGTTVLNFGLSTDKPVPADYDADGKADIAVFRPSDGIWYINGSAVGLFTTRFGVASDIPAVER